MLKEKLELYVGGMWTIKELYFVWSQGRQQITGHAWIINQLGIYKCKTKAQFPSSENEYISQIWKEWDKIGKCILPCFVFLIVDKVAIVSAFTFSCMGSIGN